MNFLPQPPLPRLWLQCRLRLHDKRLLKSHMASHAPSVSTPAHRLTSRVWMLTPTQTQISLTMGEDDEYLNMIHNNDPGDA
eukprot:12882178-Prorocentrum_lima.AAC.1